MHFGNKSDMKVLYKPMLHDFETEHIAPYRHIKTEKTNQFNEGFSGKDMTSESDCVRPVYFRDYSPLND